MKIYIQQYFDLCVVKAKEKFFFIFNFWYSFSVKKRDIYLSESENCVMHMNRKRNLCRRSSKRSKRNLSDILYKKEKEIFKTGSKLLRNTLPILTIIYSAKLLENNDAYL